MKLAHLYTVLSYFYQKSLTPLLIVILTISTSYSQQLSIDVESNMSVKLSMQNQMLVNRLVDSQQEKIDQQALSEKGAYCIAVNSVAYLKDQAPDFVNLAEKMATKQPLTLLENQRAEAFAKQHLTMLTLITSRCDTLYPATSNNPAPSSSN